MILRVVCQVCGKTEIIDVDKPIPSWICPECYEKATMNIFRLFKDKTTGEYYGDWEINWKKLSEMVEESLRGGGE